MAPHHARWHHRKGSKVNNIFQTAGRFLRANAPALLTGLGVAGIFSTAVLAARGGQKAQQHLSEMPAGLSPREKFEETWTYYVPAALTAVGSAACVIAGHTVSTRRQAALMSLYTLSETTLEEYKQQAAEVLGPKKEKEISAAAAEAHVREYPPAQEFLLADPEKQLFLETMTGRYFNSSVESLRQAAIDMNEEIMRSDYVLLNDWYERIGLDRVQIGDETGWNHTKKIELEFDAVPFKGKDETTKPIMVCRYRHNPIPQPYAIW